VHQETPLYFYIHDLPPRTPGALQLVRRVILHRRIPNDAYNPIRLRRVTCREDVLSPVIVGKAPGLSQLNRNIN